MKSGSSAPISAGSQSGEAAAVMSSYQTSRPSFMSMSPPVRRTTTQLFIVGHFSSAWSVLAFKGMGRPPRTPSSEVMMRFESQSWMRPARASGEKPPKTTEWMAPMRAQARTATAISGIMGRYMVTRSPRSTPRASMALEKRHTSSWSAR